METACVFWLLLFAHEGSPGRNQESSGWIERAAVKPESTCWIQDLKVDLGLPPLPGQGGALSRK